MPSMDDDDLIHDDEPIPALTSADHGNLGRWVQRVIQNSERRLQNNVTKLRASVDTLARDVDILAGRNETNEAALEAFSDKLDAVNSQLQQVIGKLSVLVPDKALETKQESRQFGVLNERTIPLIGLVVLTGALVFFLYATVFGDAAMERKLDRVPGLHHQEPQR